VIDFGPWWDSWYYPSYDGYVPPQPSWYYCPSARAYYPEVYTCPEQWVIVPPPG
jgi:hypothetical protein